MSKSKIIFLTLIFAISFSANAQNNPKTSLKNIGDMRNNWGLGFIYSDKGYGVAATYFKNIGSSTDLSLNLGITGITDPQEFEQFDIYGNSYIANKVHRVFLIPLNIGIQNYVFKDDIEGNFRPFVSAGITPAVVISNPYDKSYFKALGYFNSSFAFGGYVGIGMEYIEFRNVALSMNVKYYYLPVLGSEVSSLRDKPINDVGGLHINFGLNFLH
jgi:hypothetical protein